MYKRIQKKVHKKALKKRRKYNAHAWFIQLFAFFFYFSLSLVCGNFFPLQILTAKSVLLIPSPAWWILLTVLLLFHVLLSGLLLTRTSIRLSRPLA